jgi:hypothetical protein
VSIHIILILTLNFIISLIGTLAYSVRLVGVRTGKIAVSFALFNILMLISRTAVVIQTPILSALVETNTNQSYLIKLFNNIIIISGIATIVGIFLIPTFQRILYKGVLAFSVERSIPKLLIHSFTKSGIRYMRDCISVPVKENITKLNYKKLPFRIIIYI